MLNFGLRKKIVKLKHFVKEHIQKKIIVCLPQTNRTEQRCCRKLQEGYSETILER